MRIANLNGRAALITEAGAVDVAQASAGTFGPDVMGIYENWQSFTEWAETADLSEASPWSEGDLEVPVPRPPQVFGIGVNYRAHCEEAGIPIPENIVVFTKFRSSLGAPNTTVTLPSDVVDYETELVFVIGKSGHKIAKADAWGHVAAVAIGQDYSERTVQLRPPVPQFSLGKSFPNFSPFGPYMVTLDEFENRDAIKFSSTLSKPGEPDFELQRGVSDDMIFDVPELIHRLSQTLTLLPGDVIFSGTPAGVGFGRDILMRPEWALTSTLEGIGSIRNEFVAE
jgi:2,4-diketo-3-deoxy-L-fuconate hydrolase